MKAFWDERYGQAGYVYGKRPNEYFRSELDKLSPGKILLPAEGEGRNAVYAASAGWEVDAFDFSLSAREKAVQLAMEQRVKINYQIHSLEEFESKNDSYDAIGLIYNHMSSALRASFHRRMIRSLRSGGKMILEAFEKEQLGRNSGGPKNVDMLYSVENLQSDFESLDIHHLDYQTTELHEGPYHSGEARVIRLLATKP